MCVHSHTCVYTNTNIATAEAAKALGSNSVPWSWSYNISTRVLPFRAQDEAAAAVAQEDNKSIGGGISMPQGLAPTSYGAMVHAHNTTPQQTSTQYQWHTTTESGGGACVMAFVGCTSDGGGCLVCRAPGVAPNLVHLHQHHRINTTATIGTAEECGKGQYRQVYVLAIVRLPRWLCV